MGILMGILMMDSIELPYDSSDILLFLQGVGAVQSSPISCGESMCPLLDSGFAVCSVYCKVSSGKCLVYSAQRGCEIRVQYTVQSVQFTDVTYRQVTDRLLHMFTVNSSQYRVYICHT